MALVVIVVVRGIQGSHDTGTAPFATSCVTPAFELSTTAVRPGQTVTATITGPAELAYVLALDATGLQAAPTTAATPGAATLAPGDAPVLLTATSLPGCQQSRTFTVPASTTAGRHEVGLFRSRPGDDGGPVQSLPVTVS